MYFFSEKSPELSSNQSQGSSDSSYDNIEKYVCNIQIQVQDLTYQVLLADHSISTVVSLSHQT